MFVDHTVAEDTLGSREDDFAVGTAVLTDDYRQVAERVGDSPLTWRRSTPTLTC